jgi:hypothetical protein
MTARPAHCCHTRVGIERCFLTARVQGSAEGDEMDERGEGWRLFAVIMMFVGGTMRVFDSIWAFTYHAALPERLEDAVLGQNLKTYGWIYLIVAAVLFVTGFLIGNRSQIGRWVGMVAGGLLCISAVWWLPYYPVWSLVYISLGVLIVYALAAHGGRPQPARPDVDRRSVEQLT